MANELKEIERALEKHGLDELMVSADGSTSPLIAVQRICAFLLERGLDVDLKMKHRGKSNG